MKPNFNFEKKSEINPFEVPSGYFENFAQKIEQQIEKKSTFVRISFVERARPFLYAAAMIVVIFTVGTIFMTNLSKHSAPTNQTVVAYDEDTNQIMLDDISEDAMIDYILANAK